MKKTPLRPWGYQALIERYELRIPRPFHLSWVGGSRRQLERTEQGESEVFPAHFGKDDSDIGHLVFALKYDGVDLVALRFIFRHLAPQDLVDAIVEKRTSSYLRRLWFFYEFFEEFGPLELDNCPVCPVVDLLDPDRYFVREGPYVTRQRVRFNLLGNHAWCPMVRKGGGLESFRGDALRDTAYRVISQVPRELMVRALRYLHTKETRSSFEIESELPKPRAQRFVETLISQTSRGNTWGPWWTIEQFVQVQRELLDARYASDALRDFDVRVSEQRDFSGSDEIVHWVGAPHAFVTEVMEGLCQAWRAHHVVPAAGRGQGRKSLKTRRSCGDRDVDFIMAVGLSFGFVYIHPFEDGNGRVHRLLLNYILQETEFTPPGVVIPMSAAVQNDPSNYDRILQSHSEPALRCIDYNIDARSGSIDVGADAVDFFRYPDLTPHVDQLRTWFEQAIHEGLVKELEELRRIDAALLEMREIVDMPDRKLELFLKICHHNGRRSGSKGYKLGKSKRARHFAELRDEEVLALQEVVAGVFEADAPES